MPCEIAISFWFISLMEIPVKCRFKSSTKAAIWSRSTFSCIRSSWDFTRLSPIIMTTMQLFSSTGSRSKRLAVMLPFPAVAT